MEAVRETKTVNYRKTNFPALPVGMRPWRSDVDVATTRKRVTRCSRRRPRAKNVSLPTLAVPFADPAHLTRLTRGTHVSMTGYSSPSPTHAPLPPARACSRVAAVEFIILRNCLDFPPPSSTACDWRACVPRSVPLPEMSTAVTRYRRSSLCTPANLAPLALTRGFTTRDVRRGTTRGEYVAALRATSAVASYRARRRRRRRRRRQRHQRRCRRGADGSDNSSRCQPQ